MAITADTTTKQILIIDDDQNTCKIIAAMVAEAGYCALCAHDSQEALRMLQQHHQVKLILLDIRLPGSDGIGVLKALKKNPKLSPIPIIMVSAVRDTATIQSCLKLGAADFTLKPFTHDILMGKINKALGTTTSGNPKQA